MTLKSPISNLQSPRPRGLRASSPASLRRSLASSLLPAFSIVEVLFAVMILGIGFIMVAAIFPVGIQQGRDAIDDTTGRTVARDAANRAAATFRCITSPAHLTPLAAATTAGYLPIDPTNPSCQLTLPTATITNGVKTGTVGGGLLNLYQLTGGDWQYLGQSQYLSQLFFRTTYNAVAGTGTLSILALAIRDGRDPADQAFALNTSVPPAQRVYVRQCQILTDGKANIYSDIYIKDAGSMPAWSDNQITAFLGTNGAIVTNGGSIIRMQDSASSLKGSTPPAGKTWAADGVNAWMFCSDVPVIGSYTLTTSLP